MTLLPHPARKWLVNRNMVSAAMLTIALAGIALTAVYLARTPHIAVANPDPLGWNAK